MLTVPGLDDSIEVGIELLFLILRAYSGCKISVCHFLLYFCEPSLEWILESQLLLVGLLLLLVLELVEHIRELFLHALFLVLLEREFIATLLDQLLTGAVDDHFFAFRLKILVRLQVVVLHA